jgi:hypothetical protein
MAAFLSHSAGDLAHPKYRPDIDGLRAIAVLSVVAFHAYPGSVGGGFIGVDIFFVISGYLISTILFGNLEQGRFSFVTFYVRRIKRIFPALLVVLLVCYAIGWNVLFTSEYKALNKHIVGGAACCGEKAATSIPRRKSNHYCTFGPSASRSSSICSGRCWCGLPGGPGWECSR